MKAHGAWTPAAVPHWSSVPSGLRSRERATVANDRGRSRSDETQYDRVQGWGGPQRPDPRGFPFGFGLPTCRRSASEDGRRCALLRITAYGAATSSVRTPTQSRLANSHVCVLEGSQGGSSDGQRSGAISRSGCSAGMVFWSLYIRRPSSP